jgi:hypothetical protein
MEKPTRSSDVVEVHSEHALAFGLGGVVALALGGLLLKYQGDGWLVGFAYVLVLGGIGAVIYAIYCALQIRKVESVSVACCYCHHDNQLVEMPTVDFSCLECHRMIPVAADGRVLPVSQVRCGFCNELNYYSEKTEVLICEYCDHEIPIAQEEGKPTKHVPRGYAITEDDRLYELVLIAYGPKTEDLIAALQHMLALNRNQVKQMLTELPVTVLTGITRKKAEMLQAQLSIHEGASDIHPIT